MILVEVLPNDLKAGDITSHGVYIGWYGRDPEERTYEFAQSGDSLRPPSKPTREINLALDPTISIPAIRGVS